MLEIHVAVCMTLMSGISGSSSFLIGFSNSRNVIFRIPRFSRYIENSCKSNLNSDIYIRAIYTLWSVSTATSVTIATLVF